MERGVVWWLARYAFNIRGKNEYEVYRTYMNILQAKNLDCFIDTLFSESKLKVKSNTEADIFRTHGNVCYGEKKYNLSLHWYTKSQCCATYNGKEFAIAVANRSAVYFELEDYESCIKDINLCLQAKYPNEFKPKILIRKAKCFQKMGKNADMRKVLVKALHILDNLPESGSEKYKQTIVELIITKVLKTSSIDTNDEQLKLPTLEENPTFLNASKAIDFRYHKKHGYRVIAKEEIKRGAVLFVEKSFAFAPTKTLTKMNSAIDYDEIEWGKVRVQKSCYYCLSLLTSCIPCKNCVKHLYCNDQCQDAAWKEFHQWECFAVRAGIFSSTNHEYLAFRIVLKTIFSESGLSSNSVNEGKKKYGEKDNNHPFVYNLPRNINKIDKNLMARYVAMAAVVTRYLKTKTTFFDTMKKCSSYTNKNDKELMNIVGSLIIRHSVQLHCNLIPMQIITDIEQKTIKTMIAMTICPSVAIMKHSCLPNTAYYFVGDTIVVKATEDIKANEEIFRSYSSALKTETNIELTYGSKEARRQLLKSIFSLNCNCRICIDPKMDSNALDAYSCINCGGPATMVKGDDLFVFDMDVKCKCLDCHNTFSLPDDVIQKEFIAENLFMRFLFFENLRDAHRSLEIGKSIFVSSHLWLAERLQSLSAVYLKEDNVKEFLELAKEQVILCKKRYINFEFDIALLILQIGRTGIYELTKCRPWMSMRNIQLSSNILKELLDEAKEILDFYYPLLIPKVDKMIKSLQ